MEQTASFQELSLAIRRQARQIAHATWTEERRRFFELMVEQSYDAGQLLADVPSQAWMARQLRMDKKNASIVEGDLLRFGVLKEVHLGEDKRRYYELQPDASRWGGERFSWRVPDALARAAMLQEEMRQAARRRPDVPGAQAMMDLEFVPTPGEELDQALDETHRQAAREAAGTLPPAAPYPLAAAAPDPSADPSLTDASPGRPRLDWGAIKSGIKPFRRGGPVPSTFPPAALPAVEGQPLARRPTPLGTDPTTEGRTLAPEPTAGAPSGVPEPSVDPVVGSPTNDPRVGVGSRTSAPLVPQPTLTPAGGQRVGSPTNDPTLGVGSPTNGTARSLVPQPTLPARPLTDARAGTSNISTSQKPSKVTSETSSISPSAENTQMADVGSVPGRNVEMSRQEVCWRIQEVIGEGQWEDWQPWWHGQLAKRGHTRLAKVALDELKVEQDRAHAGVREPIYNPGGWFVDRYCRAAGIPRPKRRVKAKFTAP